MPALAIEINRSKFGLVETDPPPPDALADAVAALRGKNEELRALAAERERLTRYRDGEAAIIAEIEAIGAAEIDAARAWAAGGCCGDAPEPNFAARRDAQERLLAAQMRASGAERALADVETKSAELAREARELSGVLDVAIFDQMIAEYGTALQSCREAYDAARRKGGDVIGWRQALYNRAHEMRGEGKDDLLSLQILQRLEKLEAPEIDVAGVPFVGEVTAATEASAARIRKIVESAR